MLTKIPFQKNKLIGRLLLLPVLAVLAGLFAFKSSWHPMSSTHPFKKIKIVLDPGHGGANGGVTVNGIREQDFNLMLAKRFRDVAKTYDVDVILTREGDNTPEPEQTLQSSLEYRAKFAADQHADAFISLHMNNDPSGKTSGFELYVPHKGSAEYDHSLKLGSAVNAMLAKDYKTAGDLKERDQGIYILNNALVPAILLELGNMNIKGDMEFMSVPANQEKIARDIIEGVMKFSEAGTSYVSPASVANGPNNAGAIETISLTEADDQANSDSQNAIDTITIAEAHKLNVKEIDSDEDKDSVPALKKVEVESTYPGGNPGWGKYLLANLHYPDSAVVHEIQGVVLVEFIVKADGTIDPKDVKAKSGPKELRAESIRVVQKSGKWIPAMDHGVAVNAYKMQPISYKLEPKK